ncbi:glycosyltransferase family 2 protein [Primorskyibacter sp. S187A]|uniref:glycosyltransferase family 2 protein n=1 Tax=Primorskyibacter sp. S187A TaxID=3415130 RepID=UPI003C7B1CE8
MRVAAVTCVKNEGPFLLEWIAYNRAIGVTDHLFYSNDCSDATDLLLDALAAQGIVMHLPNPAQGRNYQMEALKDAARQEMVRAADWVWIADVDEFLNIHVGNHTIADLVAACDAPHAISLNFQFFANAGIETFEDRPVVSQFTKTHNPDLWCDERAIEVKTLVRKDFPLQYFGAHRPFFKGDVPPGLRWCDGAGRPVPRRFLAAKGKQHIRKFPAQGARKLATLNHYALRSLESYLVKNDRGDVNRENRAFDDTYWRERNDDSWTDLSIHRMLPRLEAERAKLLALPKVAELHAEAVSRHRAKLDSLLEQKPYREMIEHLRSAPTLCDAEAHLIERIGSQPVLGAA